MFKSFPDVKTAGDMVNRVITLHRRWRKFTSSNVDLIKVITNDLREDGMKDKDLKLGNLTDNKALEVKWNVKDDTLGFIIKMNNKTAT